MTVLVLVALFLPSLHKTPPPPSIAPPPGPVPISQAPTSGATTEQPPVLPSAPLTTEAAPLPVPQAANGLQDVDPHKAFGSKNAPVVMEEFSDYQCPACKTLYHHQPLAHGQLRQHGQGLSDSSGLSSGDARVLAHRCALRSRRGGDRQSRAGGTDTFSEPGKVGTDRRRGWHCCRRTLPCGDE